MDDCLPSRVIGLVFLALLSSVIAVGGPASTPVDAAPPAGFDESVVISGLSQPTAMSIASDGTVFVIEKRGRVLRYDSISDPTPTLVADRRTQVHNYGDRGMIGLAVHPNYPTTPYVYVTYTLDRLPSGGSIPAYGEPGRSSDPCPDSNTIGCPALSRVVRFNGTLSPAPETVLFEGHCQQFPTHAVGDLEFESATSLLVSFGDGSTGSFVEYGQRDNLCGDPPGPIGSDLSTPTTEGGQARAQDILTRSDPTGVHGSLLRVYPNSFTPRPENPLAGDPEANAASMIATGFRNPFRFAVDGQTGRIYVANVGGAGAEEINLVEGSGLHNSGWPCYEGPGTTKNTFWLTTNICNTLINSGDHDPPLFHYGRNEVIDQGEPCPNGGLAVSGMEVNRAGFGPTSMHGAVFFSDYTRDCIWYLPQGGNGRPDPTDATLFASGVGGIVDLTFGPDGDLYAVDIIGDRVLRFSESGGNQRPTARFEATPTAGAPPLAVAFDASTSGDPDGDPLSYAWDFDDDGQVDATGRTTSNTYDDTGTYRARLTVTDPGGLSNSTSRLITVGDGDISVVVTEPAEGRTFKTGALVPIRATATYADGTAVASEYFSWVLSIEHCIPNAPDACHSHDLSEVVGSRRTFQMPDHEYPSFVEAVLTVDPPDAAPVSVVVPVDYRVVDLDVRTQPSGLEVLVGSAEETAPFVRPLAMAATTSVSAAATQSLDGVAYDFVEWRLDGSRLSTQRFAELVLDQDAELVAVYSRGGAGPDTERPSPPTGLRTTANGPAIDLAWTASTDNVGVAGYRVYRSTNGQLGALYATTTSTSFADNQVSAGVTYTYAVKAVDGAGNLSWRSNLSDETTGDGAPDTERPSPPTGLRTTAIPAGIRLTWNESTDNVGVVRYQIFRSTDGTFGPLWASTTNPDYFLNGAVTPGVTYTYAVKAVDAAGNFSWRSNLSTETAG